MTARQARVYTGKRKTAIAWARITSGDGSVRINGAPLEILQPRAARMRIITALAIAKDYAKKFDIDVRVKGGGFMGQAEAVGIAVAKALASSTKRKRISNLYAAYERSFLAGDPRRKEKKKFGGPGARGRKQKSYR